MLVFTVRDKTMSFITIIFSLSELCKIRLEENNIDENCIRAQLVKIEVSKM